MGGPGRSDRCPAVSRVGCEDGGAAKIILDIMKLADPPSGCGALGLVPDVVESRTASRKEVFLIGLIPFVTALAVCIITFIFPTLGKGLVRQRDFDIDDESIQESYVEGEYFTTTSMIMYVILTAAVMCSSLFIQKREKGMVRIMYLLISSIECFAVSNLIVVVLKMSVAKLRPDFLDRCQPDENLVCTNEDVGIVEEGRLSFPSQHSSISAFIGIISISFFVHFMSRFIRSQNNKRKAKFSILTIIGSIILLAPSIVISATRYIDHKHFPVDICIGYIIGLVPGLFVIFLYKYYLKKFKFSKWSDLKVHCNYKLGTTKRTSNRNAKELAEESLSTDTILSYAQTKSSIMMNYENQNTVNNRGSNVVLNPNDFNDIYNSGRKDHDDLVLNSEEIGVKEILSNPK